MRSGRTTTLPSPATASFSRAISSSVSPRTSVCSRATFVRRTTRVRRTFVASRRPPRPASTTATSTSATANAESAAAVTVSNCVASSRSAAGRTRPTASSNSASSPFTRIRSLQLTTCGEIVAPTESPSSRSSCSIVIVAVDLPFVPTTCTAGYAFCGSPSSASRASMRSRPNPSWGQGESESSHATAEASPPRWLAILALGENGQLAAVALELLALRVDDRGRRVLDEPLVRQHALGTRDLLAQAHDLRVAVAVDTLLLRAHHRSEDAPLVVGHER